MNFTDGYLPFHSVDHDYNVSTGDVFIRRFGAYCLILYYSLFSQFCCRTRKENKIFIGRKRIGFCQLDLLFRSIIESVDTGVMTIDLQGQNKNF